MIEQDEFPYSVTEPDSRTELVIRAVNNDNLRDASLLVNLFRSHYGDDHPFRKVYDPSFWCHSRRSKLEPGGLISLVAVDGDRFVAHLGLDHNASCGAAQILLPAVHPNYRGSLFKIVRSFWSVIARQAERQQWRVVFGYNLSVQPLLQLLSAKCYHCESTALVPCAKVSYGAKEPITARNDAQSSLLVMCNVLNTVGSEIPLLYVPPAHHDFVRSLYSQIGLPRRIADPTLPSQISNSPSQCKNRKGFFARHLKRFGLFQLRVTPSALSDQTATLELIDRIEIQRQKKGQRLTVQVSLSDPKCPEFCAALEQGGYRFCGILPLIVDHDYIVYTKFEDDELSRITLYTEASKSLREYMVQHTRLM